MNDKMRILREGHHASYTASSTFPRSFSRSTTRIEKRVRFADQHCDVTPPTSSALPEQSSACASRHNIADTSYQRELYYKFKLLKGRSKLEDFRHNPQHYDVIRRERKFTGVLPTETGALPSKELIEGIYRKRMCDVEDDQSPKYKGLDDAADVSESRHGAVFIRPVRSLSFLKSARPGASEAVSRFSRHGRETDAAVTKAQPKTADESTTDQTATPRSSRPARISISLRHNNQCHAH